MKHLPVPACFLFSVAPPEVYTSRSWGTFMHSDSEAFPSESVARHDPLIGRPNTSVKPHDCPKLASRG